MKMFDTKLELLTIKSICDAKGKVSAKLFGSVDEDYFYSEPAKEAFSRILKLVRKESELPSYKSLFSDPVISETSRAILKKNREIIENEKEMQKVVKNLFAYKQARDLYSISENLNEALTQDKVDVSELVDFTLESTSKLKKKLDTQQEFFHFGKNANSETILKKLISKDKEALIPTGFPIFDNTNGGFADGGLVVFAGNTGGGKTSLAIQLGLNVARFAREDVAYIPLEMTEYETCERIFANLAGVDLLKIKKGELSKPEEKRIKKTWRKFNEDLNSDGTRFTIFCPYEGLTMTEALLSVRPYKFKMIILDYLGLLEGVGGESQWQAYGEVAREAKIWAKNTGAIVVLLVQSSDKEHILRYSQVVKEHANNLWIWMATDETRANKVMDIKQQKARNQKMFDFQLGFDDDLYRVFDLNSNSDNEKEDKDNNKKDVLDTLED